MRCQHMGTSLKSSSNGSKLWAASDVEGSAAKAFQKEKGEEREGKGRGQIETRNRKQEGRHLEEGPAMPLYAP